MALVDHRLAARVAARVAPAPPSVTWSEAAEVVAELRDLAVTCEQHVRDVTGLVPPVDPEPAVVVDRAGWAARNAEVFAAVVEPTLRAVRDAGRLPALPEAVTARATGLQLGTVLGLLAPRVLGQYEAITPDGRPGALLLVAPNLVEAERRMGVDPSSFRRWVALHEVAHRTQFTAVPWLHGHVRAELTTTLELAAPTDPTELLARLAGAGRALRGEGSLLTALQTPEQRVVLDRVTALMSLLEGHAEHVMDAVGPAVVPGVDELRRRFQQRRDARPSPPERLLRRLLGLDLKALQYAEGKVFVDTVVALVGTTGFNRVWESPLTLPTRQEVREPAAWVARVHGGRSAA